MTEGQRTSQSAKRRSALADTAFEWAPDRGDLVYDTSRRRIGVVVALPEDTATSIYQLVPESGGTDWTAPLGCLTQHHDVPEAATEHSAMTEIPAPPDAYGDEVTVDLQAVDDAVADALAIRLAMPERTQIDSDIRRLIRYIETLLAEELGYDEDPDISTMYRDTYRLLDLKARPTTEATQFGAYEYMREVARQAKRLAAVYRMTHDQDEAWQ
ncbi:hypothetical protein [Streptomyces sp. NPDC088554]|uniref:hypothetical protein n=1 Tax=Streptomyces sp. NPDC088554 TaxID=3365865 RepID=UPI00381A2C30